MTLSAKGYHPVSSSATNSTLYSNVSGVSSRSRLSYPPAASSASSSATSGVSSYPLGIVHHNAATSTTPSLFERSLVAIEQGDHPGQNVSKDTDSLCSGGLAVSGRDVIYSSPSHCKNQSTRIKEFFSKNQLCDVQLVCSDREIAAHRVILAGASDYFAAMFTGALNEAEKQRVVMLGIEPEALEALIHYCYTGEIELEESSVEALLSGACLLQLPDVVHACSEFLISQLHASNCLGIRAFADAQGCSHLQNTAQLYTLHNFMDVCSYHEFLLLPLDDLKLLLCSDDLNVINEAVVFKAMMAWITYDLPNRRIIAPTLMSLIRLPFLSPDFLADNIEKCALFREDRVCQDYIFEAYKYHLLIDRRPALGINTRPRKSTMGHMYAVGGQDSNKTTGQDSSKANRQDLYRGAMTIERYDYLYDQWTIVGRLTSSRVQMGVAVLENKIYLVGGRDGLKTLSSFESWDPRTNRWAEWERMNVPRHGLGVAVLEGPLYAVGGHDGWSYLNTVERYDPVSKTWTYVAEMSAARSTLGVAVLNGKLYAIGGRDGSQCLRSVECYSPHTNRWTHCASMCKRRGGVGVAVLNGSIYAVGGLDAPSCNPSSIRYDCMERYDPELNTWVVVAHVRLGRDGIAACGMGGLLFTIGGYNGHHYQKSVDYYDPDNNEWHKSSDLCSGRGGSCVVTLSNAVNRSGAETSSKMIELGQHHCETSQNLDNNQNLSNLHLLPNQNCADFGQDVPADGDNNCRLYAGIPGSRSWSGTDMASPGTESAIGIGKLLNDYVDGNDADENGGMSVSQLAGRFSQHKANKSPLNPAHSTTAVALSTRSPSRSEGNNRHRNQQQRVENLQHDQVAQCEESSPLVGAGAAANGSNVDTEADQRSHNERVVTLQHHSKKQHISKKNNSYCKNNEMNNDTNKIIHNIGDDEHATGESCSRAEETLPANSARQNVGDPNGFDASTMWVVESDASVSNISARNRARMDRLGASSL